MIVKLPIPILSSLVINLPIPVLSSLRLRLPATFIQFLFNQDLLAEDYRVDLMNFSFTKDLMLDDQYYSKSFNLTNKIIVSDPR